MWSNAFGDSYGQMKYTALLRVVCVFFVVLVLAACGSTPKQQGQVGGRSAAGILSSESVTLPITIPEIPDVPGLAQAAGAALTERGFVVVPFSGVDDKNNKVQILDGQIVDEYRRIEWHLYDINGVEIGHFTTDLVPDPSWSKTSVKIAQEVGGMLQNGAARLPTAKMRIKIGVIVVPPSFDGRGLRTAMVEILKQRGYAIVEIDPDYVVEGAVQILRADSEKDIVKMMCVVKKPTGKQIGVVQQENPVSRIILSTDQRSLFAPMAVAAIDGARPLFRESVEVAKVEPPVGNEAKYQPSANTNSGADNANHAPSNDENEEGVAPPPPDEQPVADNIPKSVFVPGSVPKPIMASPPPAFPAPDRWPAAPLFPDKSPPPPPSVSPSPYAAPDAAVPAPSPRPAKIARNAGQNSGSGGGDWVVQIAALKSEADARKSWMAIRNKHSSLLSDYSENIVEVDLGEKGIFWRLRVGPMGRESAKNLCDNLTVAGQACLVAHP